MFIVRSDQDLPRATGAEFYMRADLWWPKASGEEEEEEEKEKERAAYYIALCWAELKLPSGSIRP